MRNILAAAILGMAGAAGADPIGPPVPPPAISEPVDASGRVTGRPLPRLVTVKPDVVNVRRGPGLQYAIDWRFVQRGMPVEIVAEWGHWRRVRDAQGEGGWVHYMHLSGRRGAIATADAVLRTRPDTAAPIRARAEAGALVRAERCLPAGWCRMRVDGVAGWTLAEGWWGVRPGEAFD